MRHVLEPFHRGRITGISISEHTFVGLEDNKFLAYGRQGYVNSKGNGRSTQTSITNYGGGIVVHLGIQGAQGIHRISYQNLHVLNSFSRQIAERVSRDAREGRTMQN